MSDKPLFVTRPVMPPLAEFVPYLEEIWASGQLSNGGAMHQALERELCEYLGVDHIALFNNGTSALMVALQALELKGKVITTPYTFVATGNAIVWNSLEPVFVDVEPGTLNLDPAKVEAAITEDTVAIMPVHCYGTPCATAAIQDIASKHGLKVVYDAAHAFAVRDAGGSILRHGDLSVLSFHATKVFNTFEGGAVVCRDSEMKARLDRLKNFGLDGETDLIKPGINAKMNEISAAFGLLQLRYLDQALAARKAVDSYYREALKRFPWISPISPVREAEANFSYFPVSVAPECPLTRDEIHVGLAEWGIHARRYFYPLISDFPAYRAYSGSGNLPIARQAADNILCLPIYPALEEADCKRVVDALARVLEG